MLGLINKGLQDFVVEHRGSATWMRLCHELGFEYPNFEALIEYEPHITQQLLKAIANVMGQEQADLLDDFGTFLSVRQKGQVLRRFLRLGGNDFRSFLLSLPPLLKLLRISIPDFNWPKLEITQKSSAKFIICETGLTGFGLVFLGILRAMADDYNTLITVELEIQKSGTEIFELYHILIHSDGEEYAI